MLAMTVNSDDNRDNFDYVNREVMMMMILVVGIRVLG